jgi:hypothetical protein
MPINQYQAASHIEHTEYNRWQKLYFISQFQFRPDSSNDCYFIFTAFLYSENNSFFEEDKKTLYVFPFNFPKTDSNSIIFLRARQTAQLTVSKSTKKTRTYLL